MAEMLDLALFGGLRIRRGGVPLTGFHSRKVPALLAYLAVTGQPQPRAALADLLWGELPESAARANLRQALTNLRALVGAHLLIDRASTAVDPAGPWRVDVVQFEAHLRPLAVGRTPNPAALAAAAALYTGDLLAGVALPDAPAFDEWLAGQRERLRQQAFQALHALAGAQLADGDAPAAIAALRRLLALEPWHEETHRWLMELLAADGRRSEALAQYAACRRLLAAELGVEPAPETTALYERIHAGRVGAGGWGLGTRGQGSGIRDQGPGVREQGPEARDQETGNSPHPLAPSHNRPAALTSLIGRETELAQIAAHLADPACRLLTLIGPGGVGKTRLALRAATDHRAAFADGAVFVPLTAAYAPQHIVPAIAGALGLTFAGAEDPADQLLRWLGDKRLLLVLDNLEHLLAGVDLLPAILAAAPGVTLLVTSRERLAVQAEWLLTVGGLSLPEDTAVAAAATAVQLFAERARQARADFALSLEVLPAVVRICRLVDGLPLAIELAAAWSRAFTCDEIVREIERGFDFLVTSLRDVPARHRSLRAVFDSSYEQLSPRMQAIFRALAVFRDGFGREAAGAVAGAAPADLAELADKSLLHRTAAGQYAQHELLRQYGAERLAALPAEAAAARARHGAYYAAFLHECEAALKGARQAEALAAIEAEIDDVRAAWGWAVAQRQDEALGQALDGLGLFYELRGGLQEGEAAMAGAVAALAEAPGRAGDPSAPRRRLVGRLLGWQGRFCHYLGRGERAGPALARSAALLRPLAAARELAFTLTSLARHVDSQGQLDEAGRLDVEAVALFRAADDPHGVSLALNHLGGVAFDTGDVVAARRCWLESLAVRRQIGDRHGMAHDLSNLGEVARLLGEYDEARRWSEESLAVLHDLGDSWRVVLPLGNLGMLARAAGRYDEARRLHEQCLVILRVIGDRRRTAEALVNLALAELHAGALAAAAAALAESLAILRAIGYQRGLAACLTSLGELALRRGLATEARDRCAAGLALAHESGDRQTVGMALGGLGEATRLLGDTAAAGRHLAEALTTLHALGVLPAALGVAVGLAEVLTAAAETSPGLQADERRHRQDWAIALLACAACQPACWHATRASAERLLATLAARLPAEAVASARARGQMAVPAELLVGVTAVGAPAAPASL